MHSNLDFDPGKKILFKLFQSPKTAEEWQH